jgi:GNAT superfamily N-acetyltransferase
MDIPTPPSTLFMADSLSAYELGEDDIPALQRFFDENPAYFFAVKGQPPGPDEARLEFDDLPPPGMSFKKKWLLRFEDASSPMIGMASVWSDFLAEGVWHIGLFIVETSLHGTGKARALYRHLESWMLGNGARWIRLGVVEGYARAENFWRKAGYTEVRQRIGIEMGKRRNTIRVLVKPLVEASLSGYLELVVRDRPGHP